MHIGVAAVDNPLAITTLDDFFSFGNPFRTGRNSWPDRDLKSLGSDERREWKNQTEDQGKPCGGEMFHGGLPVELLAFVIPL